MIILTTIAATTAVFAYLAYCRAVERAEKAEEWVRRFSQLDF